MPTIFYSTQDPASCNIAKSLKEHYDLQPTDEVKVSGKTLMAWKCKHATLVRLESPLVEASYLSHAPMAKMPFPEELKSDLFIFASRHSSQTGTPCYTVHAPGNWTAETKLGGNPNELQLTSARAMLALKKNLHGAELEVFQEATHHGPTNLTTPSIFAELGSTAKQWEDEALGIPLAKAIMKTCENWTKETAKAALGFGGTHYCTAFNPMPYAFSHIASKHSLDGMDASMILQAIQKTSESIERIFIDWKGCNKEQRDKLISALESNCLAWEKA